MFNFINQNVADCVAYIEIFPIISGGPNMLHLSLHPKVIGRGQVETNLRQ